MSEELLISLNTGKRGQEPDYPGRVWCYPVLWKIQTGRRIIEGHAVTVREALDKVYEEARALGLCDGDER